jgi:hypothetical protein
MAQESYWHRRLTDVTLKAAAANDQRLREVYLELAAHYVSMARLCVGGEAKPLEITERPRLHIANHQPTAH